MVRPGDHPGVNVGHNTDGRLRKPAGRWVHGWGKAFVEVGQRGSFGPMRQPEARNTTLGVWGPNQVAVSRDKFVHARGGSRNPGGLSWQH